MLLEHLIGTWRIINQRRVLMGFCLIPLAALILLIGVAVWMSFRQPGEPITYGFNAYPELYGDPFTRETLLNTGIFALVTVALSLLFGTIAAWLVERTNLRLKALPQTLMLLGLLIPGFLSAMGWILLFHPRIGAINLAIQSIPGLEGFSINIATPAGMGFVQGIALTPLAFIMVSATYRSMNPALEEAAAIHGLGFLGRLRRIILPLTFPGTLAAGIYILSIAIGAFDIPAFIGMGNRVFTFSTYLYLKIIPPMGPSRYDLAGAFGVLMMVLALVLLWWYFRTLRQTHRYAVVTGKAYRPRLLQLGRWQALAWGFLGVYFLLGQILPLWVLVWNSLLPYPQPISLSVISQMSLDNFRNLPWEFMLRGIRNTLILAVSVPTLTLAVSLVFSWIVVRSRSRFSFVFDVFAFLPHSVPHILLAISAMYAVLFLLPGWLPLYGEIWLLIGVYVLLYISFATRMLNSAMMQIHQELDEAAMVSGISLLPTIRRILIPLMKPALLSAWLWIALLTYRELTVASVLATGDNLTLPAAIFGISQIYGFSVTSAAVTAMLMVMLPLIFLYWFFTRRALVVEA